MAKGGLVNRSSGIRSVCTYKGQQEADSCADVSVDRLPKGKSPQTDVSKSAQSQVRRESSGEEIYLELIMSQSYL